MNKLINPKIRLEELTHTYLLDDAKDISFTSVTTFIGQFFDEFDTDIFLKEISLFDENLSFEFGVLPDEL